MYLWCKHPEFAHNFDDSKNFVALKYVKIEKHKLVIIYYYCFIVVSELSVSLL